MPDSDPPLLAAGIACTELIANPASWINRRVETIELLTHEETRRRVSVDYSLTDDQQEQLNIGEGIAVPIAVLTKEARRNFDLRDEGGRAVPVLGKEQNGELAHIAVMNAAFDTFAQPVPAELFGQLATELGQIVKAVPDDAEDALGLFVGQVEAGEPWRTAIWESDTCRSLLKTLWKNYVLFAVLPPGGPNRRILKYGYGDEFDLRRSQHGIRERLRPRELLYRAWCPDRRPFVLECPVAWRARSFHAEIALPQELRIETAVLVDRESGDLTSSVDTGVNRASLYASRLMTEASNPGAYVEVAPERAGRTTQAAWASSTISALLWLGVASGLDASSPGSAVSLLLAGAALFSGVTSLRGEHVLVWKVFAAPQRWLAFSTVSALAGSASLAMEIPDSRPVCVWFAAAIVSTIAAVRLLWSAFRAPR